MFSKMNVLIVGAGPSGLAAAFRLASKGHHVQVLERRPSFTHGPGSIQIPVNGSNILIDWGLEQVFDSYASKKTYMYLERWHDMKKLCTTMTEQGTSRWVVHRDDLQEILAQKAKEAGAELLFDQEVVKVDTENAILHFSDGTNMSGDLIIGADGLRSIVRKLMFADEDTSPNPSTTYCYQAMVPKDVMDANPETKEMYRDGEIHAIMGPGTYIVTWSQFARDQYYVGILDARAEESVGESGPRPETDQDISLRLHEILKGWAPPIKYFVLSMEKWIPWKIARGRDVGYTSASGKVILLGDACHAMSPDAAQGISQGFEDTEALATLLEYANKDNLAKVSKAYEELRKPRASRMQAFAAANGPMFAHEDGPNQEARDARLAIIDKTQGKIDTGDVKPDPDAKFIEPGFRKWTIEYNAREEAHKLAKQLQL